MLENKKTVTLSEAKGLIEKVFSLRSECQRKLFLQFVS